METQLTKIPHSEENFVMSFPLKVNERSEQPGVSYHGPLTKITPFASVLG